jgi:chemotaxis protein methyltransferase CheR
MSRDVRPLSQREFARFQKLIHGETGIHLSLAKKDLLARRLGRRVRELALPSFSAYYRHLLAWGHDDERVRMLDSVCTNETRFFREPRHFEFLETEALPRWRAEAAARKRRRRIRAWSVACSTGEEPASVGMVLLSQLAPSAGWQVEVLGTDLSTRALERARSLCWPNSQAKQIPLPHRKTFMLKGTGSQAGLMRADPGLEAVVSFRRLNLNDRGYPVSGTYDVIFCRNVMIYFDTDTRRRVVRQLLRHLAPGGYLFVGLAESLRSLALELDCIEPGVYTRRPASTEGGM